MGEKDEPVEVEAPDLSISADEIRWRVGSTYDGRDGKMAMLLGYVDARLAMEKLDLLDSRWSSRMEPIELGGHSGVRCTLTVGGVSREDVGVVSDTEPLKGAFSDALKRAAVHFGIGRELYDLPSIGVQCEVKANGKVGKPKALPVWKNGRWTIDPALGWVKYDHEPPEEKPRPVKVNVTRNPVATNPEAQTAIQESLDKAADDVIDGAMTADEFVEQVLVTTGGEEVDDLPEMARPVLEEDRGGNFFDPAEQPDVVEVTPSTVKNVGRGGSTNRANSAQIGAVKAYSKSLGLGPHGVIAAYNDLFAANFLLSADKKVASEELLAILDTMSSAQAGELIQSFEAMPPKVTA